MLLQRRKSKREQKGLLQLREDGGNIQGGVWIRLPPLNYQIHSPTPANQINLFTLHDSMQFSAGGGLHSICTNMYNNNPTTMYINIIESHY